MMTPCMIAPAIASKGSQRELFLLHPIDVRLYDKQAQPLLHILFNRFGSLELSLVFFSLSFCLAFYPFFAHSTCVVVNVGTTTITQIVTTRKTIDDKTRLKPVISTTAHEKTDAIIRELWSNFGNQHAFVRQRRNHEATKWQKCNSS